MSVVRGSKSKFHKSSKISLRQTLILCKLKGFKNGKSINLFDVSQEKRSY